MIVRYKGEESNPKQLPGGGPQGTLLGLLLFIVLINDLGFENQENNVGDLITCKKKLKEFNYKCIHYKHLLTVSKHCVPSLK